MSERNRDMYASYDYTDDSIRVEKYRGETADFIHVFAALMDCIGIDAVDDDGLMVPVARGNEYAVYMFRASCGEGYVYMVDDTDLRNLEHYDHTWLFPWCSIAEWEEDQNN